MGSEGRVFSTARLLTEATDDEVRAIIRKKQAELDEAQAELDRRANVVRDALPGGFNPDVNPDESCVQSVCKQAHCPCAFHHPHAMALRDLKAEPKIEMCELVIYAALAPDGSQTAAQARARIVALMAPYKAVHIGVATSKPMAFLTFETHTEAARAQLKLNQSGMTTNFRCMNVAQVRGVNKITT